VSGAIVATRAQVTTRQAKNSRSGSPAGISTKQKDLTEGNMTEFSYANYVTKLTL
jgi:hypothetical protein